MTEHQIQKAIVEHIRLRGQPNVLWFAVPNGGDRPTRVGAKLKDEGVRAGVPDMHFLTRCGNRIVALYLEIKKHGGRLSRDQVHMSGEIEAAGGVWRVAYGIDEALDILEKCGVIWPDKGKQRGKANETGHSSSSKRDV